MPWLFSCVKSQCVSLGWKLKWNRIIVFTVGYVEITFNEIIPSRIPHKIYDQRAKNLAINETVFCSLTKSSNNIREHNEWNRWQTFWRKSNVCRKLQNFINEMFSDDESALVISLKSQYLFILQPIFLPFVKFASIHFICCLSSFAGNFPRACNTLALPERTLPFE